MPLEFSCPHCQAQIRVADGSAGKQGTCPQCRKKLVVPTASANPQQVIQEKTPPVHFDPVVSDSPSEIDQAEVFPEFQTPDKKTSYTRKRTRKQRSSGSLIVPLMCGAILLVAIFWYLNQTSDELGGTLEAVVVSQPSLPEGSITYSGLSVDRKAFERVREELEQQPFSLYDQHRLSEVELGANQVGLVIHVHPTSAAKVISLKLDDSKLREYIAEHARELNDLRIQQFEATTNEFIKSWDGKSDAERKELPNLDKYRDDMALASTTSGFGYHVVLRHGNKSYPCIGVGSAGELYFCIPQELEQLTLSGYQATSESPLFEGEYTVHVSSGSSLPDQKEMETPSSEESPEVESISFDKSEEPEPTMQEQKSMKPSDEN